MPFTKAMICMLFGTNLQASNTMCEACRLYKNFLGLSHADATRATSINSCLCLVGSLDGHSITTVEGLGNSAAGFHKVQGKRSPVLDMLQYRWKPGRRACLYGYVMRRGVCEPPRVAMRVLHARLCRGDACGPGAVSCQGRASHAGAADAGPGRQPLPLHRLPPNPGRLQGKAAHAHAWSPWSSIVHHGCTHDTGLSCQPPNMQVCVLCRAWWLTLMWRICAQSPPAAAWVALVLTPNSPAAACSAAHSLRT